MVGGGARVMRAPPARMRAVRCRAGSPLRAERDQPCAGTDHQNTDPVHRSESLAEKSHPEERDQYHAQLVDGRHAGGIAELQCAEITPPRSAGCETR